MFEPQGFSKDIFEKRYAFTPDETWKNMCKRVARQVSMPEQPDKVKKYKDKFYDMLVNNLFVPGGRILYNSGRPNPQLLNCFVLDNNLDSKEGWGNISRDMIVTSMSGGGCGIDFSDVRPNGASIRGQNGTAPGPLELMKLINGNGDPIRAGGARRVALMLSLDLDHSDVETFLDAKIKNGELQNANISVKCRDIQKFIKSVNEDGDWELSWKSKYKKTIKAKELWNKIVNNAYHDAEPGFLNFDLIEAESNIYYIEPLVTTNPCGEIALSKNECCCLGHLVLFRYVNDNKVDWELLGQTIRTGVRFLDNVLDVNSYPLPEMKIKAHSLRRVGLGTTGLADMLAMLGLKYGSAKGNEFVDQLYRFISKQAYEASVMLAVEKGSFPLCNPEMHVKSGYMKRMSPKIRALVAEHGIRNCALLTVAPTGTVSILSDNCSSGIEPMFAYAYKRMYWDKEERKEEVILHPLFVKWMNEGKDVSHFVASRDLTVREHMELQKVVQKHIDNAVSKTINMSEFYSIEDMSSLWLEYLPYLKGTTFYRENSRKFYNKDGTVAPPPLTALSLEEAKEFYSLNYEKSAFKVDSEHVEDCPNGVCSL